MIVASYAAQLYLPINALIGNLGNDEMAPMKLVIASAFPGETEYESMRLRALQMYAEAKKR